MSWKVRRDRVVGGTDLPGLVGIADGGSGAAIVATVGDVPDRSAAASVLAELLDGNATDYEALLASPGPTVVMGSPGSKDTRDKVEAAIADGRLAGMAVQDLPRIAAATTAGVTFVDPATASTDLDGRPDRAARTAWPTCRAWTTRSCTSPPAMPPTPTYHVIAIAGDPAAGGPIDFGSHPLPGLGAGVVYDPASQMIHILGHAPTVAGPSSRRPRPAPTPLGRSTSSSRTGTRSSPTRASGRSSPMPVGANFVPAAWAADVNADYPATDRQELLVFDASGSMTSIDMGSHAFAWRLPGVIAGAITAALHLSAAADPVPTPARGGPGRALRAGRRDVLRPVADRHERRLRRSVHRGRVHGVRRALDRLVAGQMGVLGGDARHRRPARPRPREQVGGALCHRRSRPADPRPERARPGPGDPRADRAHLRPRLHGDHRAGRTAASGTSRSCW